MAVSTNSKLPNLSQFQSGLSQANSKISSVASAAAGAISEAYENLAVKAITGNFTVATTSWVKDTTINTHPFVWYADVSVNGVNSSDRADVVFWLDDYEVLEKAEVCTIVETLDPTSSNSTVGRIRLRCRTKPTSNIRATYWLETPKGGS